MSFFFYLYDDKTTKMVSTGIALSWHLINLQNTPVDGNTDSPAGLFNGPFKHYMHTIL